jgi:hypothetical protein
MLDIDDLGAHSEEAQSAATLCRERVGKEANATAKQVRWQA